MTMGGYARCSADQCNWKKNEVVVLQGSALAGGVLKAWGEHAADDAEGQRRDP